MNDSNEPKARDPKRQIQLFLVLDGCIRVFCWKSSFLLMIASFTYLDAWPDERLDDKSLYAAWIWSQKIVYLLLLFNFFYLVHLLVLRLLIPMPKEGRYETVPGKRPSRQLVYSAFIASLTKARYEAPFPGFLIFHLANIPPMCWLMGPIFGPKSGSCYVTEPQIIDPHLVTIGRNVVLGLGSVISGHYQQPDAVMICRTTIEDDVVIGAHALLAGVHVKRGARVGAGSVVLPGSVIGPNEYWSGNPARRRDIAPSEQLT